MEIRGTLLNQSPSHSLPAHVLGAERTRLQDSQLSRAIYQGAPSLQCISNLELVVAEGLTIGKGSFSWSPSAQRIQRPHL